MLKQDTPMITKQLEEALMRKCPLNQFQPCQEKCAFFREFTFGGYNKKVEYGCVFYHLPKVIRKLDW
jgi:hypothetical protein